MENEPSLRLALKAVRRSFVFSGRSTRTELLSYLLAYFVSMILLFILAAVLTVNLGPRQVPWQAGEALDYGADALLYLPLLGLTVRRLNDQGRSRWWSLVWVPAVIGMLLSEAGQQGIATWGLAPSELMHAEGILSLPMAAVLLLPGTIGPNRSGADPRDPPAEAGS